MLKTKLQSFGHLMLRTDSLEKTLMLEKIEDGRRRDWQRMTWLDGITDLMDTNFCKLWGWWAGRPGVLQSMGSQRVGHDWITKLKQMFLENHLSFKWEFTTEQWFLYLEWEQLITKEENGNIGWTLNLHFAVFNIFFWLEMSALKNTILQLCIYDFIFTIKF